MALRNGVKKNRTKYAVKYQYFDVSTGKKDETIYFRSIFPGTVKYHAIAVTTE